LLAKIDNTQTHRNDRVHNQPHGWRLIKIKLILYSISFTRAGDSRK